MQLSFCLYIQNSITNSPQPNPKPLLQIICIKMDEIPKSFVKVLSSALIRLNFYHDQELTYEEILDQADGRTSLSRSNLSDKCSTYLQCLTSLSKSNPSDIDPLLSSFNLTDQEKSGLSEVWQEEKQQIIRGKLDSHETEWTVKGEPSWSIDIQTFGKYSDSASIPVANFKFDLSRQGKDKTLQFSAERESLAVLLSSLEQASLYLNSSLSS